MRFSKFLLVSVYAVLVLSFSVPFLAADKGKGQHHHHNHGVHLSVVVDCRHPAIQNSDDAPGWVLVQHARKLELNIEVLNSHSEERNLLRVEVVIPTDATASDYVVGLCKIEFVVDVSIVQKKGVNDE